MNTSLLFNPLINNKNRYNFILLSLIFLVLNINSSFQSDQNMMGGFLQKRELYTSDCPECGSYDRTIYATEKQMEYSQNKKSTFSWELSHTGLVQEQYYVQIELYFYGDYEKFSNFLLVPIVYDPDLFDESTSDSDIIKTIKKSYQLQSGEVSHGYLDQEQNFYFDKKGIYRQSNIQYIQFPYQIGNFKYRLVVWPINDIDVFEEELKYKLLIGYNKYEQCYSACSSCNYNSKVCQCSHQYVGSYCQYETRVVEPENLYSFTRNPNSWDLFKFELEIEVDYELTFKKLPQNSYIFFFKENDSSSFNQYQDPNLIDLSTGQLICVTNGGKLMTKIKSEDFQKYYKTQRNKGQKAYQIFGVFHKSESSDTLSGSEFVLRQVVNESYFSLEVIILISIMGFVFIFTVIGCVYTKIKRKQYEGEVVQQLQNNQQNQQNQVANSNQPKKVFVLITQESIDEYMPKMEFEKFQETFPKYEDDFTKDCTVCLCEFEPKDNIRMTVCMHIFHVDCVDNWLKKHGSCPFCRAKLTRKALKDHKKLEENLKKNQYMKKILADQQLNNNPLKNMKGFEFLFKNEGQVLLSEQQSYRQSQLEMSKKQQTQGIEEVTQRDEQKSRLGIPETIQLDESKKSSDSENNNSGNSAQENLCNSNKIAKPSRFAPQYVNCDNLSDLGTIQLSVSPTPSQGNHLLRLDVLRQSSENKKITENGEKRSMAQTPSKFFLSQQDNDSDNSDQVRGRGDSFQFNNEIRQKAASIFNYNKPSNNKNYKLSSGNLCEDSPEPLQGRNRTKTEDSIPESQRSSIQRQERMKNSRVRNNSFTIQASTGEHIDQDIHFDTIEEDPNSQQYIESRQEQPQQQQQQQTNHEVSQQQQEE